MAEAEQEIASAKRRLSRTDRHAQLLDVARQLLDERGTDEFSLGRLAARAGVSKPVAYDHFPDRSAVLVELYRDFEARQLHILTEALRNTDGGMLEVCSTVARAYLECWLTEGREMAGVVAALSGSPDLDKLRREAEHDYLRVCENALTPLIGPMNPVFLQAVTAAGDALARETVAGKIDADDAGRALAAVIVVIAQEARTVPREQAS
ncbi:TetR family transcriptional regulator [Pseudoclavibacter endophyticus]|uniref:TetR/AcrR family transcriptional regulator n=1 Tax=Pseudoclavibacter endophyticus TaxID=1778590 RepID=A0A6H9WM69_9MICO|nr:TetR/AcrR family transcriptional regulator [Pseudoclavibacter endophyticus]KAB1646820.1 TetR/AcrR family transcriptional regulator [Pseudoclavibacter endophyticus]GGA75266.1 TetR family transcriptional regulator [Pseudoclavibacter endophyticus]